MVPKQCVTHTEISFKTHQLWHCGFRKTSVASSSSCIILQSCIPCLATLGPAMVGPGKRNHGSLGDCVAGADQNAMCTCRSHTMSIPTMCFRSQEFLTEDSSQMWHSATGFFSSAVQTICPCESLFTLSTQSLQDLTSTTPPVAACVVQTSRNGLPRVNRNGGRGQAKKWGISRKSLLHIWLSNDISL